ncbi:hypothetical protein EVB81_120 [Rhizobium phage RHph_I46]|uniref:Uncharacterized protein n=1 Tax=Rhizobium phage RHph_I1_9 TaxID=2509729 RepID=A0A7S5R9F2_9CAUD|nr:hypothetical protein PP936_gp119 [Rhizobium phage RHph_I1_9]QIG69689.1 hypothetical protein EVB81_120 [Rhizobium phage RHph_I46]QIG70970.1 hypothetical protein EVB92_120 [Rhizobium phage RHph_I9]QIG73556.1 hypothetical protein EVC04_119 [Rhizobium phage RHph_I1_9]QIG76309.1 hypothetical protein EVC25_120 [Rhizobium phage RHph_I34]
MNCTEVVEPAIRGGVVSEWILFFFLVAFVVLILAMIYEKIFGPKEPPGYWHW